MAQQRDLSHVKTLKDLQSEILNVKASIIVHERGLKARVKQAPAEARQYAIGKMVPSALMKLVPFILTKGAVANSFGFIKNAAGIFSIFKKQKGTTIKDRILNTVKKAGTAAAIKGAFDFIKRKKHLKENQQIEIP